MSISELKILEPIKKYTKEFETSDEFNLYYAKHKEDIDKLTTHKLNKMYHIKGFRITRIKNVLMLKRYDESNNEKTLKDEVDEIKETMNKVIDFLNSHEFPPTEK